jgi:hypothetical protein
MIEQHNDDGRELGIHGENLGSPAKGKGRRGAKAVEKQSKSVSCQVTMTVPRGVMEQIDQFSDFTGINRQHLMREALTMYAALLATGHRVYEMPGVRRAG